MLNKTIEPPPPPPLLDNDKFYILSNTAYANEDIRAPALPAALNTSEAQSVPCVRKGIGTSCSVSWSFPIVTAACAPLSPDPSDGFLSPSRSPAQQDRVRQNITRQDKTRPKQTRPNTVSPTTPSPASRFAHPNPFSPLSLEPFPPEDWLARSPTLISPFCLNLPHLSTTVSPSPPLIADTGCTGILLQFSNFPPLSPFFSPKKLPAVSFTLPDRSSLSVGGPSHITGELSLPFKASPIPCYFLPDSSLSHSLVGISPLLRPNGHAIFTSTSVSIFDSPTSTHPFLTGSKTPSSDLWFFSVPSVPLPRALNTALFSLASLPAARFVAYHHRSFGSPSLSTFLRALSRGYIHGIPLLTHTLVRKFPPLSLATAYGHLNTLRQGVASTRRTPPPTCLSVAPNASLTPTPPPDPSLPDPDDAPLESFAVTSHRREWASADLTGRFPVKSVNGHEYILVTVHLGYIHLTPLKNRSSASYVSAFSSVVTFFKSLSHPLTFLHIDNETSSDLTAFFRSVSLPFQLAPPQNHRSLPAERAIQTAKNHLISTFSSCHATFPPNRWPDLLPQSELSLNHLLSWSPNPSLSAWHGLHGAPFSFASHPIHPPGQLVVAHDSPSHRASWAKHGTRGFYLSPSTSHYRCANVFLPLSASYRVCETLEHFPDPLFPFEDPVNPPHYPDPTLTEHPPPPPIPKDPPYPIPIPPTHPPPPLTTSVGTAGAPLVPPPPILPSFFTPQVEPAPAPTIAHRTRSARPAPLTQGRDDPLFEGRADLDAATTGPPSSPTPVPTPGRMRAYHPSTSEKDSPSPQTSSPARTHEGVGLLPPPSPPSQTPLTHGARRVEGIPPFPPPPLAYPPGENSGCPPTL